MAERRGRRVTASRVLVLVLLLALAACGGGRGGSGGPVVSDVSTSDHDGYAGALLPHPYRVPAVALEDTAGHRVSLAHDARGRLSIVFFGYTRCPDICQVVMGTIASAYARLDQAEQRRVRVVFVTTDPARDTGPVLRRYLDRLNASFVGLTGPLDRIDALGKPMGVYVEKGERLPSGGYDVTHTTSVIAVNGHGRAPLVWSATVSPAQLAGDITKLLRKVV